jgi:hypothetical protein
VKRLCDINYPFWIELFSGPYGEIGKEGENGHPFMQGAFITGLSSDSGDERLWMCGRVNDYGNHRIEKELDTCPFAIQGSEVCRLSAVITQGIGEAYANAWGEGHLEYNMVEAKGCGDLHCRFIIEDRKKYPMPPKELWDCFGPVATYDQAKVTPEDQMVSRPQQFREECGYKYRSGLDHEANAAELFNSSGRDFLLGVNYILLLYNDMIAKGEVSEEKLLNIIECVFRGAGKTMFSDFFAKKGLADWLGAPPEVLNDGRLLGAYLEILMQMWKSDYKLLAFNKDEVVFDIERFGGNDARSPLVIRGYLAMWYGMAKTLVGPEWAVWRETEGVPDNIVRVRIAKKIDKFGA